MPLRDHERLEFEPEVGSLVDQLVQHVAGRVAILLRLVGDIVRLPSAVFIPLHKFTHDVEGEWQRESTARHESGHLLTAVLSGIEVTKAWINPNPIVSTSLRIPLGSVEGEESGFFAKLGITRDLMDLISPHNRPEVYFDKMEASEIIKWLFYALAGQAIEQEKSASELYTINRWEGIYAKSGSDFAVIANAFHHSKKYGHRAQQVTTKLFNRLKEFFQQEEVQKALNALKENLLEFELIHNYGEAVNPVVIEGFSQLGIDFAQIQQLYQELVTSSAQELEKIVPPSSHTSPSHTSAPSV